MTSTIQDYAVIGDGRSCALVAKIGSIDFLCWPRFDSDACLAALLGDDRHGYWLISPAGYVSETTHCYRDDTTILETDPVLDTDRDPDGLGNARHSVQPASKDDVAAQSSPAAASLPIRSAVRIAIA
jgi:hypothetical protein